MTGEVMYRDLKLVVHDDVSDTTNKKYLCV